MATADGAQVERLPIIDTDVHAATGFGPETMKYLPTRWREHVDTFGMRGFYLDGQRPLQRPQAARTDTWGPNGEAPGFDPDFVRMQLLDLYDMSGAVINNNAGCIMASGGRPGPDGFAVAMARAMNDARAEQWLAADPRWYGSINVPYECLGAEKEIVRCREEMGDLGDRWVQILLAADNEKPIGHQKYWPLFEVCEQYDIVVGFHVYAMRRTTGTGSPNFYIEEHTQFADFNFPLISSLVFEGVFDRFPRLKIALIELAWSWSTPYAWRLDRAYELMKGEVPHLQRKPSEYLADHVWYSTQPMEEPEHLGWFDDVYGMHQESLGDRLMYSSDYPHWDFDAPDQLPSTIPVEARRKILGENASKLYGIPLRENSGLEIALTTA
jgi:uncharacterized protein